MKMQPLTVKNKDKKSELLWEGTSIKKEIDAMLIKSGMRRSMPQDMVQSIWKSFLTMDAI
jgi:hypothetical protein